MKTHGSVNPLQTAAMVITVQEFSLLSTWPRYHMREQTCVSSSAPHPTLRKAAGSDMNFDHLHGRPHLLFSMHREPAHSGPSEAQETHPILTRARSLPWHPNACGVTLAQALVLDPWSLLQPFSSVQFSSVAQLCPTFCEPMNRSLPELPVHHQLPEIIQTRVHRVIDAIQASHPPSSHSSPSLNPSRYQSLFQ